MKICHHRHLRCCCFVVSCDDDEHFGPPNFIKIEITFHSQTGIFFFFLFFKEVIEHDKGWMGLWERKLIPTDKDVSPPAQRRFVIDPTPSKKRGEKPDALQDLIE